MVIGTHKENLMKFKKNIKIKIATWNVNGIRAAFPKGLEQYLEESSPNILCLQEIKAMEEQTTTLLENMRKKYHCVFHSAKKAGYSGVMTFIDRELINTLENQVEIENGIGNNIYDDEGRMQIITTPSFILLGGYYPNGQRDHSRVNYKLDFSNTVLNKALELSKKNDLPVLLCGDFNTAHKEIDLKNPKANTNTTGFLPHERAFIDHMINSGFYDLFREKYPNKIDAYTWWTYRGDCRERNIGWRLDYFFGNKQALHSLESIEHRTEIKGSDHCPVEVVLKI